MNAVLPSGSALADILADCGVTAEILGNNPPIDTIRANLGRLSNRVRQNGLSSTDIELLISYAARELQEAKVTGGRDIVAKVLRVSRDEPDSEGRGSGLDLTDPKPWPDPVEGPVLLDEIGATFERFLALPDGASVAMALWTLYAHAHDAFSISPCLALTSAVRGSGKTSALTVLHAIAPRSLFASNISASAVFRTIEAHRPTLFIDEADTFLRDRPDLLGVLNAGHFRAGASVSRSVGEDHEPRLFSVWCPKAIAKIGTLPPTLRDRSIVVRMRRRRPDERVERIRLDRLHSDLNALRRRGATWARDHLEALREADPYVPVELRDRQADNARPLLAIADLAGTEWPEKARRALLQLQSPDVDDEEAAILLLSDLRDLFGQRGNRLRTTDILDALTAREERPWGEWRRGQPLSGISLSRLLRSFGVRPKSIRFGAGVAKGYERDDFEDVFVRYLYPATGYTGDNSHSSAANAESRTGYTQPEVTGRESGRDPHKSADVTDVTGRNEDSAEVEEYLRAERAGMQED